MRKIMTIVGTRPELIKMSRVIAAFDLHTEHVLVHTGQNYDYELNQIFFEDLGIRRPDHFLDAATESAASTIARVIERSDELLAKVNPDAVLLYGDTNSCLAVISAKRRKIPVFHMEAGNRCFDQRVPEELNRKILDHLSDVNLVLTEHARRYLIAEGIRQETIIKTGSHMREVLEFYEDRIRASEILSRLDLVRNRYFVVSLHREENVDSADKLSQLIDTLNAIAAHYDLPVILSTHPRTRKRIDALSDSTIDQRVKFLRPFGFSDYVHLQMNAYCTISDSGTITEESALLGFPAVTIRPAHERPEGMDSGVLVMSGGDAERVIEAVEVVTKGLLGPVSKVDDYENPRVSQQILRVVLSYIDYVNRTVWSKSL
ncbi:non-hydrolyzing UDP-N-acetylglucosamine 2-epimerase [Peteryoungia algae]|uniref:UDP-N-acetylglucosamine 2-epimerase (Non-hydrolyzing) n=1 Tax=Peteryoungia algae TaxID=2919917 RepID=A0ABT0CZY4_9HYPH|nr:UDP-N-acetylglucosamine 2-epimerase (non-hydrolyzing) [Rhizobium sp. SSM4.3]MCJ8238714.1 UDP-N-acetylglucosamine 2-epimerase (non-hydrolyzing) [Rhizobium sp. SSM4.3]